MVVVQVKGGEWSNEERMRGETTMDKLKGVYLG